MDLASLFNLLVLGVGFGFVIFWHELGHFLAAKWAGVRVEQFAVGFGNAIFSYRQGLGLRRGTSAPEYRRRLEAEPDADISPTEYRLNWLPLGGYVKMLGQEDLAVSNSEHEPDSYQAKTVGQRLVIISAGVVMNVILAAFLFTALYVWGFTTPAALVGQVVPGTPADRAGLEPGDRIAAINNRDTHNDFSKLRLGVALADPDEDLAMSVVPRDGGEATQRLARPEAGDAGGGMLTIGVLPMPTLDLADAPVEFADVDPRLVDPQLLAVLPGERVVAVDGEPVEANDYPVYAAAIDAAGRAGRDVTLTVEADDGTTREENATPRLMALPTSPDAAAAFGGLRPLLRVDSLGPTSLVAPGGDRDQAGEAVLRPGDTLLSLRIPDTGDRLPRPTRERLGEWLAAAGSRGQPVELTVDRGGETVTLANLPLTPVEGGWLSQLVGTARYGLGASLTNDLGSPSLAAATTDAAPESIATAGDARVTAIDGESVESFFDVGRLLREAIANDAESVTVTASIDGETIEFPLALTDAVAAGVEQVAWTGPASSIEAGYGLPIESTRQTFNPVQAVWWGVLETRDQIANLYLTLRRVTVDRTVAASNLSGPVGILHFGTIVAARGYDWLLWFLAMLSANLAVVNFLPIPILDGGHVVFLLWEKIRGKAPPRKVQEGALWVGLAALGCFVVFVTFNDIGRLIPF